MITHTITYRITGREATNLGMLRQFMYDLVDAPDDTKVIVEQAPTYNNPTDPGGQWSITVEQSDE